MVDTMGGISNGSLVEKRKDRPKTIRELLAVSQAWLAERGVESARLDAELLLAHALGETRLKLYLDMDRPLSAEELDAFRPLLARRGKREPVAYILGEKEFYGLPLHVTPDVLVPRPDSETVVERALDRLPEDAEGVVVDVCTGSGCIAVALAAHRPRLQVIGTDTSKAALAVAARNVARHGLEERVELREGDLLAPASEVRGALGVVGNPPYIRPAERDTLAPEVRDHEPALALYGEGPEAVGHHARILAQARDLVRPGGFVILEAGHEQAAALRGISHEGFSEAEIFRDLAGSVRGALWIRS